MKQLAPLLTASVLLASSAFLLPQAPASTQIPAYAGFDRNDYPGDAALPLLRRTFRYTGYWLNNPPGDSHNTWTGKRLLLKQQGFGFMVLFNAQLYAQLKGRDAALLGATDGKAATGAAAREGFLQNVRIFLDEEEGGRLLPEQAAYLFAWIDAVRSQGARAGVYCSGIEVPDGSSTISTALDILAKEQARSASHNGKASDLVLWAANDQCPPSPGCIETRLPPSAGVSVNAKSATTIWQYAQSPRRNEFSANCPKNNNPDGNCYAPGLPQSAGTFLDLNTANSPDPSEAP